MGTVASLNLAPGGRVFLIENRSDPTPGIPGNDPYVVEYWPRLSSDGRSASRTPFRTPIRRS